MKEVEEDPFKQKLLLLAERYVEGSMNEHASVKVRLLGPGVRSHGHVLLCQHKIIERNYDLYFGDVVSIINNSHFPLFLTRKKVTNLAEDAHLIFFEVMERKSFYKKPILFNSKKNDVDKQRIEQELKLEEHCNQRKKVVIDDCSVNFLKLFNCLKRLAIEFLPFLKSSQ